MLLLVVLEEVVAAESMCQSLVTGEQVLVRIILGLSWMQRAEASSSAVYHVSQSKPIDSRAPAGKRGDMYP